MRFLTLIIALAFVETSFAQAPDFGGKVMVEKMKGLSFLVGEWSGSAKFYRGGQTFEVQSSEKVEVKAGGTALFITGTHWMDRGGSKVVIHDAAAMLTYDNAKSSYRLVSQLANGLSGSFEVKPEGKGIIWSAPAPDGATMRYTMRINEAGDWYEVGESSTDGKAWTKVMELTLKKVPTLSKNEGSSLRTGR